jgi:hypothetical protein
MGNSKAMAKDSESPPAKPGDSRSSGSKPTKKQITEIAKADLNEARSDPRVEAFLRGAKERGERLRDQGLIHK